jgi:hypothetical protein
MKRITIDWLNQFKPQLVKLSNMTECDIRNIWILPNESRDVDLTTIEYSYNAPLYQKMIFRYRQCEYSAPGFFRQIDVFNQQRMLDYFSLIEIDACELVEFFAWIKNGLGSYDLTVLEFNEFTNELCQRSNYVQKWKANQVTFFFDLSDQLKLSLIYRYNKECVDAYNEMIQ